MNFHEGLENKFYTQVTGGPKELRRLKKRRRHAKPRYFPQSTELPNSPEQNCTSAPEHITILPNGAVKID